MLHDDHRRHKHKKRANRKLDRDTSGALSTTKLLDVFKGAQARDTDGHWMVSTPQNDTLESILNVEECTLIRHEFLDVLIDLLQSIFFRTHLPCCGVSYNMKVLLQRKIDMKRRRWEGQG